MSDCTACANPTSGRVTTGCRGCTLREIALGPHFFASIGRSLTPGYRQQLRALGDEVAVHAEVKAMAKTLHTGATRA